MVRSNGFCSNGWLLEGSWFLGLPVTDDEGPRSTSIAKVIFFFWLADLNAAA